MITDIHQLLAKSISWNTEVGGGVEFFAYVEGDLCPLTMNDFPGKPLYTLRWKDSSIDLNDRPFVWHFPAW